MTPPRLQVAFEDPGSNEAVITASGPLEDQVNTLGEAVREVAMLRALQLELPRLIREAKDRANAAADALGLEPAASWRVSQVAIDGQELTDAERASLIDTQPDTPAVDHSLSASEARHASDAASADPPREPELHPDGEASSSGEVSVQSPPGLAEQGEGETPAEPYPPDTPEQAAAARAEGQTVVMEPPHPDDEPTVPAGDPPGEQASQPPSPAPPRRGGRPLGPKSVAIMRALEDAHPIAISAGDLAEVTGYPLADIYGRLNALTSSGRAKRVRQDGVGKHPLYALGEGSTP